MDEHNDHTISLVEFFQPPPIMSPLPIILIVNLSAKSNQKPNE